MSAGRDGRLTKRERWLLAVSFIATLGIWLAVAWPSLRVAMFGSPTPKLVGESFESVTLKLRVFYADEEDLEVQITDAAAIERLCDIIEAAEPARAHACSSFGYLVFNKPNGQQIGLSILAGHDEEFYEYRYGRHFRMNRADFLEAMKPFDVEADRLVNRR